MIIAPVDCQAGATKAAGEIFYQGIVVTLAGRDDVRIIERTELKTVLDELDLAAALSPETSGKTYAAAARQVSAKRILVPSLCMIGNDYLLTIREISITDGSTKACAAARTRLTSKFESCARQMADRIFKTAGDVARPAKSPTESADAEATLLEWNDLRDRCVRIGAEKLFPALWQRAEAINEKAAGGELLVATDYYAGLLQLSARALSPPDGMIFIPGGYVEVNTSAGKRRLWVEPFFIDRQEVSVRQYLEFLGAHQNGAGRNPPPELVPITMNHESFNKETYPVTGVTWKAASAYAKWRGKRLPTVLQWMRAACGDDEREYPNGGEETLGGCNLKGPEDGFAVLAPAEEPGKDVSPFGVVGMTGNVREWTDTWASPALYADCSVEAPSDPASGIMKVVKGGSWRSVKEQASCKYGVNYKPAEAMDDVGFRCVIPFFGDSLVRK